MARVLFWACPECRGDLDVPPEPTIRCVGCGCTLDGWARRLPQKATVQGMMFPDAFYERLAFIDDPS
ncbi:MAG TPA: hypothetical protein VMJ72_02185 [Candidatus Paceibacterota bacterium]|nr:hypothetical protein [Candidatus Paceibacterota bacterium]